MICTPCAPFDSSLPNNDPAIQQPAVITHEENSDDEDDDDLGWVNFEKVDRSEVTREIEEIQEKNRLRLRI